MSATLPIEIYDLLEKKIGREEARDVAKAIEQSLDIIEKKAETVALQKKIEVRDELTKDFKDDLRLIREEMVTKAEFHANLKTLEERFNRKIDNLRWEFRLYFLIIIIIVLFLNPRAFDLISRLLGIVK